MPAPRCSARLAARPPVTYFSEADLNSEIIEEFCEKKGYEYTDDLITEFNEWLSTTDKGKLKNYDWYDNICYPMTQKQIVLHWAKNHSKTLIKQKEHITMCKYMKKYFEKNNTEYSHTMVDAYLKWHSDPTNYRATHRVYRGSEILNWGTAQEVRIPKDFVYDHPHSYSIKKWFTTLKKVVVA